MSNTPILTPESRNSISPRLWWRTRQLLLSTSLTVLMALWVAWCWDNIDWKQEEALKLLRILDKAKGLQNDEKMVFFTVEGFDFDLPVKEYLRLSDEQRYKLWVPTWSDTKIEALLSLTPKERIALWVEYDYQEFLALLRKKIK